MKLRTTAALLLCALSLNARALDFGGIPPEEISVYVKDLQSGRIIEEHRADESMNPASTMKLVTAFAAFRFIQFLHNFKAGNGYRRSYNLCNAVAAVHGKRFLP